jgi:hypothetical protein
VREDHEGAAVQERLRDLTATFPHPLPLSRSTGEGSHCRTGDKSLEKAVARYAGPKGNLQFPLDQPIPYDLIGRIVEWRVKQDSAEAAAKRAKRKKQ